MVVVRFSEDTKKEPPKKKKKTHNVQWHEFLSLDAPHPCGVLPAGNRLMNTTDDHGDVHKACPLFGQLRDETWLAMLGFCNGISLGNVVQTCRFFYVAGHQPELWRDLVLRKLDADNTHIKVFGNSWKDTYVLQHCQKLERPSRPIKVPGLYSDDLYRLHSCRAFAIPNSWKEPEEVTTNKPGSVPRVLASQMTSKEFVTKYEIPNQPVVIQGAAKTWKAFRDWQDPNYLLKHTKGRTFRATSGAAPLPANFTLEAFQKYCSNPILEEAPLYLFDRQALTPNSVLHQDFYPHLQKACPYFDPQQTLSNNKDNDDIVGHDLFQVLGEGKRPDHTWAIVGGSHSGSVFHIDPNATHAWNAAICGRKRWLFYPPGVTPPGVHPSQDGDEVALPLSIGEWILTFWREHEQRKRVANPSLRPLECTAFPGDVVFVPHGWWHMVINMDQVNMAITHNYVSRSNLSNVLRFLQHKQDQISGCRDRAESIKPAQLHSSMIDALERHFGTNAQWLVQAKRQSEQGWTCNAWKDDDDDDNAQDKKRSLAECVANNNKKQSKKHHGGDSVMVKAKAKASAAGDSTAAAPFSFSFL